MPVPVLFLAAAKAAVEFTLSDVLVGVAGGGVIGGFISYLIFGNKQEEPKALPPAEAPVQTTKKLVSESTQKITKGIEKQAEIKINAVSSVAVLRTNQDSLTQAVNNTLELAKISNDNKQRLQQYIVEIKGLMSQGVDGLNQMDLKLTEFKTFLESNKMELGFIDLINDLVSQNKLLLAECQVYQKMISFFLSQQQSPPQHQASEHFIARRV